MHIHHRARLILLIFLHYPSDRWFLEKQTKSIESGEGFLFRTILLNSDDGFEII